MKITNHLLAGVLTAFLSASSIPATAATPLGTSGRYSEWITRSEMKRVPNSYKLDYVSSLKWQYSISIELEAMFDTYLRYGGDDIKKYCTDWIDKVISSDGTIYKYKMSDYNLDNVRPGHLVSRVYDHFPEAKNLTAIKTLMEQLENQNRTKEGVYWHKDVYAWQVWLDGIFMGLPFRVLNAPRIYDDPAKVIEIYDDAVDQVKKTYTRTLDEKTGLNRHAWDETNSMFWADKTTGLSQHCWGRAQGWYTMAMVELLETFPEDYARRNEIVELLVKCFDAILEWQDKNTHTWYQVMDCPDRSGNYLEATCSSMFTYSLLKASRCGWVDKKYQEEGLKAYDGLVKQFIKENSDGRISLTKCCAVAGLGPDNNRRRDGSFEYYISEEIHDNDAKGVGPFIWASLEREILTGEASVDIAVADDAELPVEVYNLQGVKVADNLDNAALPSGIYILRQGSRSSKVVIP